ncbi:MAG: hypothetical protein JSR39_09905, partial [Verrucomicrobia bacterium]|nr:hypothetical protein [Verrucomicrobiota bacterium]
MHLRYSCILLIATASSSLFAASQTFIPQGPAPLIAPILFDPAGPNMDQSGAIQSFAINPGNPQNIYACSTSGGVWSSNNFGASWTPLLDGQQNLSVQSIAFDPSDPTHQTLVVGTGITSSGIALTTPTTTLGGPNPTGLYYTTNGGSSWSSLGSTTLANQSVVNVLANGPKILAATYEFTNPQPPTGYGLFVSTDTGTTFNLSPSGGPNQLATGPVSSLVTDPTNTTLYAAVAAQVTLQDTALYKSTDGGSTWQPVFGAAQSNNVITPFVQTMIKAATGPSGSIAAFVQPVNNTMAVFLSLDEGATWTQLDTSSIDFLLNASPGKSSITIDANDPTVVYVTGSTTSAAVNQGFPATVYRLKYTGSSTETTSLIVGTDGSASHADSRMSLSLPDGSLIVSSDGGIALRTNANGTGGVWQSLVGNNLGTLEAYSSAYDANHFLALTASQDNGICVQNTPNQLSAAQQFPSDGFQVFVDDKSVSPISLYYFTSNDESARQMDNAGGTILTSQAVEFNPLLNGLGSPIVLNLKDPTWLAVNSPDADNVHSDLSIAHNAGGLQFNQTLAGKSTSSFIDFAYGTQDNLQALVACAPGDGLYFTTDATVVNSLALLPAYATQSGNTSPQEVVFDPRSYQRFFATDSAKVYQTLNSGTSFTTLTQVPANLAYVRSLEFISNNGVNAFLVGGYSSDPSLSTIAVADSDSMGNLSNWRLFGLGLPNVFVMDMTYSNKADALLAGTWGRGAWLMYDVTSNFTSAATLQFGLANNDSTPDSSVLTGNRPLNKYGTGTLTITGSPTFTGLSTVYEGTMLVNGSIPGDVMVNSGGNLKGTGTIGGLVTIASGGLLAPGNPSGALTVGSLNLQPSSSTAFQLVPSPADSSHLIVTG